MRKDKGFSIIVIVLLLSLIAVSAALVCVFNYSSNTVGDNRGEPSQTNEFAQANVKNQRILNLEFIGRTVYIHFVSGESLQVGTLNGSVTEYPSGLKNIKYSVSPSGRYVAFEDLSGGLDSVIRVYSLDQNGITTLYVDGTSTIMDLVFMPGDVLVVMSGYPSVLNEQWLTAYEVYPIY
ncbi:hypothetical protein KJ605_01970 [Patescibacteria group bacterium]|nr:hypothetical protein [Patescibacteria group bacterium]MBU1970521.1 hypothetical protein [Patescibacteria group bacterium]